MPNQACRAGLPVMVDAVVDTTSLGGRPGRQRLAELLFRGTTRFFAVGVLLLLGAVMVSLLIGALPGFPAFGFGFLVSDSWNPVKQISAARRRSTAPSSPRRSPCSSACRWPSASPCSSPSSARRCCERPIGVADRAARRHSRASSTASGACSSSRPSCNARAAVPPDTSAPFRASACSSADRRSASACSPPASSSAIMVLPFIAAVMRDVFETVPAILRESAYGLGATTGKSCGKSCCPTRASASSAASCSASAARSARRWR